MSEDYCDLCDLPRSTCVHGMPPAPKPEAKAPAPAAVRAATGRTSTSSRTTTSGRATSRASKVETPVRRAPRRWSPPELFAPHIVAVLQDAGGELPTDAVFAALAERLGDHLLAGDSEQTPEGELRWRRASRIARRTLTQDGLMVSGTPGVWQLTDAGMTHPTFVD